MCRKYSVSCRRHPDFSRNADVIVIEERYNRAVVIQLQCSACMSEFVVILLVVPTEYRGSPIGNSIILRLGYLIFGASGSISVDEPRVIALAVSETLPRS